ncbi:hypothetical protein BD309DRAFT_992957 [Dichomitus squalens]|uniref:Uncharacterized protein n=1 Tax=Dichomitus squalens TaxID=114155 RepID=A0A4V2K3I3_9APHY|nr:hypothetical protein BD309DRAFT_992957 [Dichomitus squalens]TBU54587.1 hypothetical protein BD310DRAFT_987324 [Dichomitus squalens]
MLQNRTDLSANSDGYALHIATFYSSRLNKKLLEAALSAFLFGVLNLLTGAAIYCLIRRGMHNLAPKLLIGCALLLYLSTSMYWASIMQSIAGDNAFLDLATKTLVSDSVLPSSMSRTVALQKNNLVINIALIINNIIGDAIVWWRVWIIWRQSPVRYVGPILISATLALAIAANLPGSTTTLRGGYYVVNVWDLLAAASSFAMNAIAVSLIGYRTW